MKQKNNKATKQQLKIMLDVSPTDSQSARLRRASRPASFKSWAWCPCNQGCAYRSSLSSLWIRSRSSGSLTLGDRYCLSRFKQWSLCASLRPASLSWGRPSNTSGSISWTLTAPGCRNPRNSGFTRTPFLAFLWCLTMFLEKKMEYECKFFIINNSLFKKNKNHFLTFIQKHDIISLKYFLKFKYSIYYLMI